MFLRCCCMDLQQPARSSPCLQLKGWTFLQGPVLTWTLWMSIQGLQWKVFYFASDQGLFSGAKLVLNSSGTSRSRQHRASFISGCSVNLMLGFTGKPLDKVLLQPCKKTFYLRFHKSFSFTYILHAFPCLILLNPFYFHSVHQNSGIWN